MRRIKQTAHSPGKREVYLEMARTWDEMALRWEKKIAEGLGKGHQSFE
jgi:hypothetical protein